MADARENKMADKNSKVRTTRNSSSNLKTNKGTSNDTSTQSSSDHQLSSDQEQHEITSQMIFKQNQDMIKQNQEIVKQNQEILTRMNKLELSTDRRIKEIIDALSKTKHEVEKVIESQNFLSDKFDNQNKVIEVMSNKIKSMDVEASQQQLKIKELTKKLRKAENSLDEFHFALNDLEQYGRKEMMNISGVPRLNNEDTDKIVMNIASKVGVDLKLEHIGASHRTSQNPTAPIIVKFNCRRKRDEMWGARFNLKNVNTSHIGFQDNSSIYFNESLTEYNRSIFKKAWDRLKRSKLFDRVITENGITYAWKTYNREHKSEKLIIREEIDIEELLPKIPNSTQPEKR